jgi:hypothetical protein
MKNRAAIIFFSLLVAGIGCAAALKTAETIAKFQIDENGRPPVSRQPAHRVILINQFPAAACQPCADYDKN